MTKSISSLNNALQKANIWLNDLKDIGQFENEEQAYSALRSVLHTLRDRLTPDEVTHLGSELPMVIRGIYYEGFDLQNLTKEKTAEGFMDAIAKEMRNASLTIPSDKAARAVFILLQNKISAGQMNDVINLLPKQIRELLLKPEFIR